jgi:glycosyltransferase involved in cell wall biosynthesis
MRVILVQYRPAIRLYKWAVTLQKYGVDVTIAYTTTLGLGLDWGKFKCERLESIKSFSGYDRYISFNPGLDCSHNDDTYTIQAVGDLKNCNAFDIQERNNLKRAYSCVFVSETQRKFAEDICLGLERTHVYLNGVITEMIGSYKPKIQSDKLELVYSGTITNKVNHRNIIDELKRIKDNNNCNIHIYPSHISKSIGYEDFIIHDTVSPYDLISELSQYHAGIFVLGSPSNVSNMAMPNKIFEYLSAGLPVLCPEYSEAMKFNDGISFMNDFKIGQLSTDVTKFSKYYNEDLLECLK